MRRVSASAGEGARYLVVPGPSLWWLDHYQGLAEHLCSDHTQLGLDPSLAAALELTPPTVHTVPPSGGCRVTPERRTAPTASMSSDSAVLAVSYGGAEEVGPRTPSESTASRRVGRVRWGR